MESGESIISRDDRVETVACEQEEEMDICDLFPVIQVPETALQRYRKVPVTGLAALGAAFSQLPDAARTIVRTTTTGVDSDATLFVGINPKGIPGYLIENQYGTDGNIMQINEQGKRIIAGRMRFKPVDSTLPVKETVQTTTPYDPTLIIHELRIKSGLSQEELAQRLMVTRQAVSRWENGETVPNTDTLKLLSEVFDVSINTLLGAPRQQICQCCGMPLNDEIFSREPDGAVNEEYCKWCYAGGEFKYKSIEQLIDFCVTHMASESWPAEQVRAHMEAVVPQLAHWK